MIHRMVNKSPVFSVDCCIFNGFLSMIHRMVNKSPGSNSGIPSPGIRADDRSRRDLVNDERLQRRSFNVIYSL
jgi:hypothetical protein